MITDHVKAISSPALSRDTDRFAMGATFRSCFWAMVRFALFALLFMIALRSLTYATQSWRLSHFSETALLGNIIMALSAFSATCVMSLLERRSWLDYGLGGVNRAQRFVLGLIAAVGLLILQLGLTRISSDYRFGTFEWNPNRTLRLAGIYAALFLAVSFAEEYLWRGYALVTLARGISFWPATTVLSVIFGLVHLNHATESPLGIVSAILFGMILAYSFRRTRSLWFSLGFHAMWNYAQGFIFGVPVSGVTLSGALLHPVLGGPPTITGGKVGPEGSWWILLTLALLMLLVGRLPASDPPLQGDEPTPGPLGSTP